MSTRSSFELNVSYVSTAPPRRCGIAAFAAQLASSVSLALGGRPSSMVAVVDPSDMRGDAPSSSLVLRRDVKSDYVRVAKALNRSDAHVVNLHHEFSLFGGIWGRDVVRLLERIEKPVVTTCHTVLVDPNPEVRFVFEDVLKHSDRVICMSASGARTLRDAYGLPEERLRVIPLGVPDLPFVSSDSFKAELGLRGKMLILTFGLLGPNKGIEAVIRAMSRVVRRCPDAVYLVLGQTHPTIRNLQGEEYRATLQAVVRECGLTRNVMFQDRFVDDGELARYLLAADICVTPYLEPRQSSSWVLAHAMAAGKAIVSSPFLHALDLLSDGSGLLAEAGNSDAIADALIELLEDEAKRGSLRDKAYLKGRSMVWEAVGRAHLELFDDVAREPSRRSSRIARMPVTRRVERLQQRLLHSHSAAQQRLGRILAMARRREWAVIARKAIRNLRPVP